MLNTKSPLNAGHARLVNSNLASELIKLKADVLDEDSQVDRDRFGLVPVNAQPRGFIPLNSISSNSLRAFHDERKG